MRPPVAIILAICSLPLVACSRAADPPAVAPQQYGGTHPNSYDSSSRPNSYERGDGNSYDSPPPELDANALKVRRFAI